MSGVCQESVRRVAGVGDAQCGRRVGAQVASLGLEGFEGTYGDVSSAIFGYCLMLLTVLLGLSPTILKPPELFGVPSA